MPGEFDRGVFINCPFDEDFKPLLEAMLFCCIELGFEPRIATESIDSATLRLPKITSLIKACRYSIHDLSRHQAKEAGEYYRLNMPFELGIDYGCREYGGGHYEQKRFLIIGETKYEYQKSLSDIAGCDPQIHKGDYQRIIRVVRNWLVNEAGAEPQSPSRIIAAYTGFLEWNFERLEADGYQQADIVDRPTIEFIGEIKRWIDEGRPPSFN